MFSIAKTSDFITLDFEVNLKRIILFSWTSVENCSDVIRCTIDALLIEEHGTASECRWLLGTWNLSFGFHESWGIYIKRDCTLRSQLVAHKTFFIIFMILHFHLARPSLCVVYPKYTYLINYVLSYEANSCPAIEEIHYLLWNP
jgi:hypothetical protein